MSAGIHPDNGTAVNVGKVLENGRLHWRALWEPHLPSKPDF